MAASSGTVANSKPNSLLDWFTSKVNNGSAAGWQAFGEATQWDSNQKGQSVGVPLGTPIPAQAGIVKAIIPWGFGDWSVVEDIGNGLTATVGHLGTPFVTLGQKLQGGETLALSRGISSPISSGPHIDVRIQQGGSYVNPLTIIAEQTGQTLADLRARVGFHATTPAQTTVPAEPLGTPPPTGGSGGNNYNLTPCKKPEPFDPNTKFIGGLASLIDSVNSVSYMVCQLLNWMRQPGNWYRMLFSVFGVILIIVGILVYSKPARDTTIGVAKMAAA